MSLRYVLLTGGIGGAKLALGMQQAGLAAATAMVVNTGDDFRHLGLCISPDLDTLMYTLAGRVDTTKGWGRAEETWHCLQSLSELGAEDWFNLGDRDLAVHLLRTQALARGQRLTEVTGDLCSQLGLSTRVLPATDQPVATQVRTAQGMLAFQEYFVRQRAEPVIQAIEFAGAEQASPSPEVLLALQDKDLQAIIIAPSNPYLSIAPILAIPGMQAALKAAAVPIVAISPIVGGRALKGPTAKIMQELGREASALEVARHYQPWIDGFILDNMDEALHSEVEALGLTAHCCNTVMHSLADRAQLAQSAVAFASRCQP
ncbi:MAG: 2-phospho-L-lactate transferase [Gammaproteobacteria bacterium]